jgi:hypothetical protein
MLALLIALPIRPACAQQPAQSKYIVSIGTPSETLASGTLWLYSYSWYGLQRYKLAAIHDGAATLPLDTDRLMREADPHPNTDAYVVVIEASEHLWFRTPDISPDSFWTDLPRSVRLLGAATELPTGEIRLVLPATTKRRITFLYPDGRPRANLDIELSVYMSDQNHCGFHEGLPLGSFRTDATGTIEVSAPHVPLYLDGLQYYASAGTGPDGRPAYSSNTGMKISADETVVVKVAWDVPEFTAQLQLLSAAGRPRPNVDVYANWNTNACGGADRIARTDARGIVRIDLDATTTGLTLINGGPYSAGDAEGERNTRELSSDELLSLFSRRKLTIHW